MPRRNKGPFHRNSGVGSVRKTSPEPRDIAEAFQLLQTGKISAAERICREVLRANSMHADANNCLGVIQQRRGHPEQAVSLFEKTLAAEPEYVPAYGNLANSLAQLGRVDDARSIVDRALGLRPEPAIANRALGELGYQVAEYDKAAAFYQRALALEPGDFHSHAGLGSVLRRLGRFEEALACCDHAIALQPGNPIVHVNRGNLLSDMGRIGAAIESYRQSIRLRPDYARAYQLLAGIRKHTSHDAEIEAMEALYGNPGLAEEDRMNLAFGLGKAFDDLQEYDRAFEYFQQANRRKRSLTPYSIADDIDFFERLESTFDTDFIERHRGLGSDDDTPIFVLGMPRSGTSLVEQILASHSLVHGAGELADLEIICRAVVDTFPDGIGRLKADIWKELASDYLQRLRRHSADASYITDKLPHNFINIGMLAVMLPNAKIIHCRRDPMDNCLSLFKNIFGTAGHQWSYDLKDLGRYYRLYMELMEHWERVIPGRIYAVQYEDLVRDPEGEIRSLLDFCEIPFDPACLTFHESKRIVQTLSFAQVRQPIYNSSVQLWKRYQMYLQPLIAELDKK